MFKFLKNLFTGKDKPVIHIHLYGNKKESHIINDDILQKCLICKKKKPLSAYHKGQTKYGTHSYCKPCRKKYDFKRAQKLTQKRNG